MTGSVDHSEQYVLHPSVAAKWWLYHTPNAPEASRFLSESLAARAVRLLAVDDIEPRVLGEIAAELGPSFDVPLAELIAEDVHLLFSELEREGLLRLTAQPSLIRDAFLGAAQYQIPFADALPIVLAERSAAPLLVLDEALYQLLQGLETSRPGLKVTWLPDLIGR